MILHLVTLHWYAPEAMAIAPCTWFADSFHMMGQKSCAHEYVCVYIYIIYLYIHDVCLCVVVTSIINVYNLYQ